MLKYKMDFCSLQKGLVLFYLFFRSQLEMEQKKYKKKKKKSTMQSKYDQICN